MSLKCALDYICSFILKYRQFVAAMIWFTLLICAPNAQALQYRRTPLKQPRVAILARGPIVAGDFARLSEFIKTIPKTDRIMGFIIDSPGGNVFEAENLADMIAKFKLSVAVPSNSECSSACFLLFAAASRRIAASDALIGVHSVSEDGKEDRLSMAATTALARDLAALGVPPEIIGKLVETPPDRATWLTLSDLTSMGVIIVAQEQSGSFSPPPSYPARETPDEAEHTPTVDHNYSPSGGAPSSNGSDSSQTTLAYEQGLADRYKYETWFARLSGDYREGAEYWAAHRSLRNPGSCYTAEEGRRGDWMAGCLAARKMLTPSDIQRKSDPEYRAGWNSY